MQTSLICSQSTVSKHGPADRTAPLALVAQWRSEADFYCRDGFVEMARVLRRCASELETASVGQTVNLTEAAKLSGYSPDHLRRIAKEGAVENLGQRHAPRFRADQLPKKNQRRFRGGQPVGIFSAQSYDGRR